MKSKARQLKARKEVRNQKVKDPQRQRKQTSQGRRPRHKDHPLSQSRNFFWVRSGANLGLIPLA